MARFFNQYKEKQLVYQEVREPVGETSTARLSLTSSAERSAKLPLALASWDSCSLSFLPLPESTDLPHQQRVDERGKEEAKERQNKNKAKTKKLLKTIIRKPVQGSELFFLKKNECR